MSRVKALFQPEIDPLARSSLSFDSPGPSPKLLRKRQPSEKRRKGGAGPIARRLARGLRRSCPSPELWRFETGGKFDEANLLCHRCQTHGPLLSVPASCPLFARSYRAVVRDSPYDRLPGLSGASAILTGAPVTTVCRLLPGSPRLWGRHLPQREVSAIMDSVKEASPQPRTPRPGITPAASVELGI